MIVNPDKNCIVTILKFVLIFAFIGITTNLPAQTYGLKFKSHDVVLDQRTELDLSPNKLLSFQNEFELSFDYRINPFKPNDYSGFFGYVFRIISKGNNNVDLLITPTPTIYLNLVVGKNNSIARVGSPQNAIDYWTSLRIKFMLNEDRLIFYTPDSFYVQENIGFKNDDSFKIVFGANDYQNFKTSDVPSMSIKDVRIFEKGKLKHHWPLDEEEGGVVQNRVNNKSASVKNPTWLKNKHQTWEPVYADEIQGNVLVAADVVNGKLFFVGDSLVQVFSAYGNSIQTIKYQQVPQFINPALKAIYNNRDKKIYCYEVDGQLLYSLNLQTGVWTEICNVSKTDLKSRHHNAYFYPEENSVYIFGGYGVHTYNNSIRTIDLNNAGWNELPSDKNIYPPRYLAGMGSLNDTLYILGGYGSTTGSQMVNPHSYFDLVGYSLKNQSLFKKFEIPRLIDDMCVVNNMWIDQKTRNFYALIFEKMKFDGTLQLIKGSIDHPTVDMVGNTIPFKFQDIKSNAGLYYFPAQNKLFAFTTFAKDSSSTEVSVYSINYPPNKTDGNLLVNKQKENYSFVYFAIAFVFLSGFLAWFFVRKRNTRNVSPRPVRTIETIEKAEADESLSQFVNEKPNYQIVLFGGFQVFGLNNSDITNKFSPLLKELFLLILLYTHKNNKGISSEKLTEYLWFDKSEISARNNRAVNIAKLKAILSEIGAIELTKKTGYWKIICNHEEVKCDYADFLKITSSKSNLTKQNVNKLVEITQKGAFLLNVNYEWLDDFKADVSDKIVDTLVAYAEKSDLQTDAEFLVRMADCIFNFDRSNEEAMILKCKAEYFLGKHSLAKLTYEKFIKEYQILYDEEYKRSFNELVKA